MTFNIYLSIAGRPSNLIAKVSAILGWFDSHRRGDPEGKETKVP